MGHEPRRRVVGAVLAGGSSRRMGEPKAALELGGRPLVEYPLEAIEAAGIEAVVVAKRSTPLPSLAVDIWHEADEPAHPLLGIATALKRARGAVVVCGCDMPFLAPALIKHLACRPEPLVVPRSGERLHPLLARYDPALELALAAGLEARQPVQEVVEGLRPAFLDRAELRTFGDPERLLFNINTPADLAEAEAILQKRESPP